MAKKKIVFEEAMKRLEEIVNILENQEVSLDKSIELYKEGIELSAQCREKLEAVEKEVSILKVNSNGGFEEEPFEFREDD